jgi:predicted dehydrogenase
MTQQLDPSRRTRMAVVGLGYWGPNLVRNVNELANAELAMVCDSRRPSLEKIARRYPGVATTDDFHDVIADPTIDAILLATPVSTHHTLAQRALRAGKHVFVEKPLAGSAEEAATLLRLAEENSCVLMVGHTFLYSPAVNAVRDLIQEGAVGDIYFISMSRVNLGIHQTDVSVVWDLGPHDFSILRYWLDENPIAVSAASRGCVIPGKPDVAFINLEFPSGVIAHVELSWLAPSKLRRTTIVGSSQMIVYDDTSSEPVRVFDSGVVFPEPGSFGEYQLSYRTGSIVSPRIDASEPLFLEMQDFCTAIQTGRSPRSSGQIGFDVVRVIEAVHASLDAGGGRIAVAADSALSVA